MFQRTGRTPDEIMEKPEGVQKFLFQSMTYELEKEDRERQALKNLTKG